MQRRASSTYGWGNAPVGQASRQAVHWPQWSLSNGSSLTNSRSVNHAAKQNQLPASGSGAFNASPAARETAATAPAGRDVFAIAAWRVRRGAGS